MSGIFVGWARENGRSSDLARELGLDTRFVYSPGRFGLLGRYARQLRMTRRILATERPTRLVLMLPPAPALLSLAMLRSTSWPTHVAFDLHTGFFSDPKWRWAHQPALKFMRAFGGTAVVTNDHLRDVCTRAGVRAIVLHDVIAENARKEQHGSYVICPLSYANDEPVDEILDAARQTPEIEWKFTGRAPADVRAAAPKNVTFTDFVDDDTYAHLVERSLGVVALTTRAHTMQRAGYEAFAAGVPQVTSDFPELRAFYQDSAEYAGPHAGEIAAAVLRIADTREALTTRLSQVRLERIQEQQAGLDSLKAALGLPQTASVSHEESRA